MRLNRKAVDYISNTQVVFEVKQIFNISINNEFAL